MTLLLSLALLGAYTDVGYASTTGATFTGDIDRNGNQIVDTSGPVQLGGACTAGATGDVCVADDEHLYLGIGQRLVTDDEGDDYIYSSADAIIRFYVEGADRSLFSSTSVIHNQSTWRTSATLFQITGVEADLTAGSCSGGAVQVDTGGANREWCRCNTAGTAYDCCTFAASPTCSTNGPVD